MGFVFWARGYRVFFFPALFTPVDRKLKIYRATAKEKRASVFPFSSSTAWTVPGESRYKTAEEFTPARPSMPSRTPEQVMLEALPASVLIDSNFQVVYTHGNTRKYLGLPEGVVQLDEHLWREGVAPFDPVHADYGDCVCRGVKNSVVDSHWSSQGVGCVPENGSRRHRQPG
jgi:hypothetical protein